MKKLIPVSLETVYIKISRLLEKENRKINKINIINKIVIET